MALSVVQICNLALTRIGSSQVIASLDPSIDGSNEAAQCALVYPAVRDEVFRAWVWPWTFRAAQLTLVAGPLINNGQRYSFAWTNAYRYPTDCVFVRRLVPTEFPVAGVPQTTANNAVPVYNTTPWRRKDGNPYPAPFALGNDNVGKLILTDLSYASLEYTSNDIDPTQFPADFSILLAWRVAMEISYSLARSNDRREHAEKMYMATYKAVQAMALNEGQSDAPWMNYQGEAVRTRW